MTDTRNGSDASGNAGGLLFYIVVIVIIATCGYLMVILDALTLFDPRS